MIKRGGKGIIKVRVLQVRILLDGEAPMKITTKGQVTIPIEVRERLGFLPNTEVQFRVEGHVLIVEKAASSNLGSTLVDRMRGRGTIQLSTDQILAHTRGE